MSDLQEFISDFLRVRSTAYTTKSPKGRWSTIVPEHDHLARFHLVVAGTATFEIDSGETAELHKGDYIVIPNGREHNISSKAGVPPTETYLIPDQDTFENRFQHDDDFNETQLLCGFFHMSLGVSETVMSQFPKMLIVRGSDPQMRRKIELMFSLIQAELQDRTPHMPEVLNRLTEVLCLYALFKWLEETIQSDTRIARLFGPRFRTVLENIHADPSKPWTVEDLAQEFGQSRSVFAANFRSIMGHSPIAYVTRLRMERAMHLLGTSSLSLAEIAARAGYSDTNAFGRAFKRGTGLTPAAYRKSLKFVA